MKTSSTSSSSPNSSATAHDPDENNIRLVKVRNFHKILNDFGLQNLRFLVYSHWFPHDSNMWRGLQQQSIDLTTYVERILKRLQEAKLIPDLKVDHGELRCDRLFMANTRKMAEVLSRLAGTLFPNDTH